MASKRMFSNEIISSDIFMSMPLTTQALYFHLCMNADDDGFVDNPKAIMRLIGAKEDDIKILLGKRYILAFESGIIVIKHWFIHNWIRQDRLKPTNYQEELCLLVKKENGAYTEKDKCQSSVSQVSVKCQHRLDKSSIDKNSINKLNNNTVCATSKNEVAPTPTKYVFPCKPSKNNKKTEWVLSQEDLDWYLETYPNLDINLELRKAWRWIKENNLKTYSGMGRFISSWLARANNQTPSKRSQELKDKARETYIQVNKPKSQQIAESFDQVEEYAKAFIGEIDDTG